MLPSLTTDRGGQAVNGGGSLYAGHEGYWTMLQPLKDGEYVEVYRGERRRHPRLYKPFPVLVRGVDAGQEAFESQTVLVNFSTGGLYVWLTRRVEPGAKLLVVIRFSTSPSSGAPAPCVAVRGVVRRVDPESDGMYGVGVAFTRHRFL